MSKSMSNLEKLALTSALGEYLCNDDINDELIEAYLADDGDHEYVPDGFIVWEPYEDHPWHDIVERIETHRSSKLDELKSILNIVKQGIIHETSNGG